MFGEFLGSVAATAIKVVNLPAEAVDSVGDYMLGEDPTSDFRAAAPGRKLAREAKRLIETLDD